MKKRLNRALSAFLALMMVVSMLPTTVFATDDTVEEHEHDHEYETTAVAEASSDGDMYGIQLLAASTTTYRFQNWEIDVSATGTSSSESNGTLTVTAENGDSAQIYVANWLSGGSAQGVLSFQWAASNVSGLTINGTSVTASSGSFRKLMQGQESVAVTFTAGSLSMSNFVVKAPQAVSAVAFAYDSNMGSVSVDGTAVANGSTKDITVSGSALVAAPASGATFLAWTDGEGNVLSREKAFTLIPSEDMTVKAVFVDSSSTGYYLAGGTNLFTNLNDAAIFAKSNGNQTVVLLNDAVLPSGRYTIPAEVTFIVPYDETYKLHRDMTTYTPMDYITEQYTTPTAYRTLTMAKGAVLTVYGTFGVSGRQSYRSGCNGAPTGPVGFVEMQVGSTITIKDGGNLYAWGYVTGTGAVHAESGATVYECFQATDWRGGTATMEMVVNDPSHRVFPMSQYYVQNVEVPLTFEAGAEEYGYMSLTALNQVVGSPVPFIGENGMFDITDGCTIKDYSEETDQLKLTINGTVMMSPLVISSPIATMDSKDFVLPINGNLSVVVKDGGSIQVKQDLALLPGMELTIEEDASCTVHSGYELYVYDLSEWGTYCSSLNVKFLPILYAPGKQKTRTEADLKDAAIQVNGTLDATQGAIYTTASGANICSTGNGTVAVTPGTKTVTYQAIQYVENETQKLNYINIAVTSPKLKNGVSSPEYTETSAGTYNYLNGLWRRECVGAHTYDSGVVTAPTCTENGYTTYTCTICGNSYETVGESDAALGHSWADATCTTAKTCQRCYVTEGGPLGHTPVADAEVPATCTGTGLSAGWHCSVCNEVLTAQTVIPALGHTERTQAAVPATCTTTGLTEGKYCSVCNAVLAAQTTISALGHTSEIDEAVAATCTTTGLTEGAHCAVCKIVLTAQEEVAALGHDKVSHEAKEPTCDEIGWDAYYTCSRCDYTTYVEKEALGHDTVSHSAKTATCTEVGWGAYVTCSRCDYTTYKQIAALGHNDIETKAKAATCTEVGWNAYVTCTRCKRSTYAEAEIPALGHKMVTVAAQAATCTAPGWNEYRKCSNDGCTESTYVEIPALSHAWENHGDKAPTCTEGGYVGYLKCKTCGEESHEQILPANGHTEVVNVAVEATCTKTGLTEGKYCSVCKLVLKTQEVVAAKGHSPVNHEAQTATCEGIGWDAYVTCDREGCTYTTYSEIAALGHNMEGVTYKLPTCTEGGWSSYKQCSRCTYNTKKEIAALGHTMTQYDGQDATCTEDGWEAYEVCKVCSNTTYKEIPASGHKIVEHEAQAATCGEIGWDAYETCENCDHSTYKEIAALGHDEIGHIEKAATCEGVGWDAYVTCSRCDYTTYEEIAALGHKNETTEAKAATCTEVGWNAYETCTRCKRSTYAEAEIPALGHIDEDNNHKCDSCSSTVCNDDAHNWISATCTSPKTCDICGLVDMEYDALGHEIVNHEAQAPTCEGIGWDAYVSCGREGCTYKTYSEIKELGHDELRHGAQAATCEGIGWDAYVTCSRCDYTTYVEIPALGHKVEVHEAEAPTCVLSGYDAYETCEVCDYTTYVEKEALGHDKVQHEAVAATCTKNGVYAYETCAREGCYYSTRKVETALGHDMLPFDAKEATCTEIGWDPYAKCSRCGYTEDYVEIAALGHEEQQHDGKNATCTEGGWNAYVTCTRCDYSTYEETEALGHEIVNHEAQAATCEGIGWYAYDTCSRCDYTTYEEIAATGHRIVKVETTKQPNCTEAGYEAYEYCSVCDYSTYEELSALNHDTETHEAKSATCTEIGWASYETCKRSGCNYTTYSEIAALGHDKVAHAAKAAACEEVGWNAYDTCSRCDYTTYVEIPAPGHTLSSYSAKAATCTEIGWNAYAKCSDCNYTTYVEIAALGHDITNYEAKVATCTEIGWEAYEKCSRCNHSTYVELDTLEHDRISHDAKNPTCTEIGWSAYYTCSREGCTYTTYKEIAALGHTTAQHEAVAATCTEIGWEAYVTCVLCDYTTYQEIEALGHDKVQHEAKAATCLENGWNAYETCKRCNYTTYTETFALDHDLSFYEAKEATCEEVGWAAYGKCSRCDYSTYAEIAALGHDEVEHYAVPASCTEVGWDDYVTCTRCDYSTYEEIEATGHNLTTYAAKAVTCLESGWNAYEVCSACDHNTFEEIAALGHDITAYEAKAATCTEIGWAAYEACGREGCTYSTYEGKELPALGHDTEGETQQHEAKAATCTEVGWNAYVTCSRCDYSTYEELPALGHNKVAVESREPSCTETGWEAHERCDRCGYAEVEETPALGHDSVFYDGKAATCTESGWAAYEICNRCGYNSYAEIAALGHDLMSAVDKEPTCTETGISSAFCWNCDYETQEELPVLGHTCDEVTFNWSAGGAEAEAVGVCTSCAQSVVAPCAIESTIDGDKILVTATVTLGRVFSDIQVIEMVDKDESAFRFEVSGQSGYAGDVVEVTVSMVDNPGIIAACLSIYYDADKLTLVSAESTELLENGTFGQNTASNPYLMRWADPSAAANNEEDGVIAILSFKIAEDCAFGQIPLALILGDEEIYDVNVEAVSAAAVNGYIEVVKRLSDEVNDALNELLESEPTIENLESVQTAISQIEKLEEALTEDTPDNDNGTVGMLAELEATFGSATVEIENADFDIPDTEASIVGAVFNAGGDVTLTVAEAKTDADEPEDCQNVLKFSLTLTDSVGNEVALSNNAVKVVLPIPGNINPALLTLRHYVEAKQAWEMLEPYVYEEGGQWYATFTANSFSDFAFAHNVTAEKTGSGVRVKLDLHQKAAQKQQYLCAVYSKQGQMLGITILNADVQENSIDLGASAEKAYEVRVFTTNNTGTWAPMFGIDTVLLSDN